MPDPQLLPDLISRLVRTRSVVDLVFGQFHHRSDTEQKPTRALSSVIMCFNAMMRNEILKRLDAIKNEENVEILYACESGSRAWGFPSADSDYDVRFIYMHDRDWYLAVDADEKRDVIERPINDELDISGWDLRKALKLLRKSNPPLLEWLSSPIVYIDVPAFTTKLREAITEFHSPAASFHHYLNMARNNYREHMKGDLIRVKKYFYILRPLLAIRWIENGLGPVPMEFEKLVEQSVTSPELKTAITDLLERKKSGQELDQQPKIPVISDYIQTEITTLQNTAPPIENAKPDIEKLNVIFREALKNSRPRMLDHGTS